MKQTAIELFVKTLYDGGYLQGDGREIEEIINKHKRIENSVMFYCFHKGKNNSDKTFDDYYNETYGGNKWKNCKGCNITKPTTEFYKHNSNNDGLNGKCKECIKAYSKRVYDNAMNDPLLRRRMAEKIRNYNKRVKQKRKSLYSNGA